MKIICVCGLGMGSSLILKMTVEKALSELGISADVEHSASGTIQGLNPDIIVASEDFRDELAGKSNVVYVKNVVKVQETKDALSAYLAN